ncbi:hypothetical protein [Streptomyces sp. NPDC055912]|uniref:hypothetical protein n=1 Tax=Streptomyces sp. NPDC055912 TaxID=3345660 RepID=UPI0035DF5085
MTKVVADDAAGRGRGRVEHRGGGASGGDHSGAFGGEGDSAAELVPAPVNRTLLSVKRAVQILPGDFWERHPKFAHTK